MNPNKPAKALAFIVTLAETIVVLDEIWKNIQPDVKKAISSLVEFSLNLHQGQKNKTIVSEVRHD